MLHSQLRCVVDCRVPMVESMVAMVLADQLLQVRRRGLCVNVQAAPLGGEIADACKCVLLFNRHCHAQALPYALQ
jgi:hypothetical protein